MSVTGRVTIWLKENLTPGRDTELLLQAFYSSLTRLIKQVSIKLTPTAAIGLYTSNLFVVMCIVNVHVPTESEEFTQFIQIKKWLPLLCARYDALSKPIMFVTQPADLQALAADYVLQTINNLLVLNCLGDVTCSG